MNKHSYQNPVDGITDLLETIDKLKYIFNTYSLPNKLEPLEAKKLKVDRSNDLLEQIKIQIEVSHSLRLKSKVLNSNILQLQQKSDFLRKKSRLLREKFSRC